MTRKKKAALVHKSVNDYSSAGINVETRWKFFQKPGFMDLRILEKKEEKGR